MYALILAAGDGGRLHPLTRGVPKPLLKLAGRPILHHVLGSLVTGGVKDAIIVIGYHGAQIRAALADDPLPGITVRFIENAGYERGNARSIWAARDAMQEHEGFVLAMGDHLVEHALIASVVDGARDRCRLAIDRAPHDDPRAGEATLALVRGDRVVDLGKQIPEWNALDTGVFWCTPRIFDAITPELRDGEAGAVFASLARSGELDAVDVTGRRWIDIDTAEDLEAAEAMLVAETRP
jgi:choline kinase